MKLEQGTYRLQGIPVTGLCKEFGTPVYVYDAGKITDQIDKLLAAFEGTAFRIKYAAKASTTLAILRLMKRQGIGLDVVSIEEARLGLAAGFTPSDITFTPSGVSFDELIAAVDLGLAVTIDSIPALSRYGEKYGKLPCSLRLNPGIMAGGNLKISTGHGRAKFGIPVANLKKVKEIVDRHGIVIHGLHIHTGSEIEESDVFMKMADIFFSAAADFPGLRFLDFGGGFKVPYREGEKGTDIQAIGQQLGHAFNAFCKRYGRQLELWVEPGKFLVSEAGYLFTTVSVVKETPQVTFACVNSGLNHLIRPMMYGAYHRIVNVSNPKGPVKHYDVVGYICETDTFGDGRDLNEVREGDILTILNAGAYGFVMSSNYNSRLRPPEVLIEDGKALLIRERERFEDLMRGQV